MPLNRPHAPEILEALARHQQEQLLPALTQQLAGQDAIRPETVFHARIVNSLLQLLTRESRLSAGFQRCENESLQPLGGDAPALCKAIDAGVHDGNMKSLVSTLNALAAMKLAIDSPAYSVRPVEPATR